jgi:hypothetical protein
MPEGHQARASEQRDAEVVLAAQLHVARVQPHAHSNPTYVSPVFGLYVQLGLECSRHRVAGARECGIGTIANCLENTPGVGFHPITEELMVTAEGQAHRPRVLFE